MKNEPGKIAASAGRNAPTGGKPSILIVDDERNTREGLAMALRREWNVRTAESKDAALARLAEAPADVMLSDVRMPGGSGLELLEAAHKAYPRMACVLLTAYGSVETAVEAMKLGAADFLTKPVNLDQLDIVLARTLRTRALERENRELKKRLDARYGLENIVGSAPAMERVFDIVRQAAPSMATVLVEGPSGTGKELVAQAIHHLSPRAAGPFVAVHCAALSPTLLESELFGHEKGAFTGAVAQTRGRVEQASGGTLFLDEVGEIAPEVQVKLLRVLETRTFERVGGSETLRADFRIVAATNRDLKAEVAAGRFREDLYYRLAVVLVRMPTLAERAGDIPMLCDHFLKRFAEESGTGAAKGIEPAALALLQAYPWPGNVRELRNAVERMTVLSRGDVITVADVPPEIREAADGAAKAAPAGAIAGESLADAEKRQILAALERAGGNRSKAADELGINRRTLHRKLAAWGVPSRRERREESGRVEK